MKKLGADWDHKSNEYVCFYLDKLNKCSIPFNQMNRIGRRYTNYYSFQRAMEEGMQEIIFLANDKQIRMWKEIHAIDRNLQIRRSSKYDPSENWDESVIEINFTFKNKDLSCVQKQDTDIFLINGNEYEVKRNLYSFLTGLLH